MGGRYILEVTCPNCGAFDDDVYYAPTSGFLTWKCHKCETIVDLEKYTGIDAFGTARTTSGMQAIEEFKDEQNL